MATYTATLSRQYTGLATYSRSSLTYDTSTGWWTPASITPPSWISGRRTFNGYSFSGGTQFISSGGSVVYIGTISGNKSASESWKTLAPAAMVRSSAQSTYAGELVYDAGVWYSDYAGRVVFDAEHPMQIPERETYRFVGCYSTDSTTSTKYIDADGTPTADFPASITSDMTMYAQWEKASEKITISASYGDFAFTVFYQSTTPDGGGRFGYYTDPACAEESRIYGIPVPDRELYSWGGLRASSSTSGTLYANADGSFTAAFLDLAAAARTVYGSFWTAVSYKITVNANSGAAPASAYYTSRTAGGVYADWLCETAALAALPVPARSGYRFLGYFSSTSGGTKYAEYDGAIQSALDTRKATTTIYAQWRAASCAVELRGGASGSAGTIFYDAAAAKFFDAQSVTITHAPVPTDTGNVFAGYYTAEDGGDLAIDETGAILPTFAPSGDVVLYARMIVGKSTITVDAGVGAGGTATFYYDIAAAKFYADSELTEEIASVDLPGVRLFDTLGLYDDAEGGTQVVSPSGAILQNFAPAEESVTVYARYVRRCHETLIDAGDGYAEVRQIYHAPGGSAWYADDALTEAVSGIGTPLREGYTFGGCSYGGAAVISAAGEILAAAAIDADYIAIAEWTANTYTLNFNANGGTASFASKTVTFGAAVGQLPTAAKPGTAFDGWRIDGLLLGSDTVWGYGSDRTAVAQWADLFGDVTDYYGFGGSDLIPVESDDGSARPHAVTREYGRKGADSTSPVLWRNPTVKYMVVRDINRSFTLGVTYNRDASADRTAYMLTSVNVETGLRRFPTITLSGVANEGASAINRFAANFKVAARARAQALGGFSISGGGELHGCSVSLTCDPVVLAENQRPCASDVVGGRLELRAETLSTGETRTPTVGGADAFHVDVVGAGVQYRRCRVTARREIV